MPEGQETKTFLKNEKRKKKKKHYCNKFNIDFINHPLQNNKQKNNKE